MSKRPGTATSLPKTSKKPQVVTSTKDANKTQNRVITRSSSDNKIDKMDTSASVNVSNCPAIPSTSADANLTQRNTMQTPTPNFITPNRFGVLAVQDDDEPPSATEPPKPTAPSTSHHNKPTDNQSRPPPIFVKNILNYGIFYRSLKQSLGVNEFLCQTKSDCTIVRVKTIENYRKLVHILKEEKADFHTYQLKEDRAYRVVIRNLHTTAEKEEIKSELENLGFKVRNISNVFRADKKILPLFFVDLEPSPKNADVFRVTELYGTSVRVEEPYKNRQIAQCKRCQDYGHTRTYCNHGPRCVKCGDHHWSGKCSKTMETPAKCALCNGNHPANYRGCATHKELQMLRRSNDVQPVQPRISNQPRPMQATEPRRQTVSYASALSGASSLQQPPPVSHPSYIPPPPTSIQQPPPVPRPSYIPPPPSSTDLTSMLSSFLNEFRAVISPLVTLLTTVMEKLLPILSRGP